VMKRSDSEEEVKRVPIADMEHGGRFGSPWRQAEHPHPNIARQHESNSSTSIVTIGDGC
jgi:hypothetical protein